MINRCVWMTAASSTSTLQWCRVSNPVGVALVEIHQYDQLKSPLAQRIMIDIVDTRRSHKQIPSKILPITQNSAPINYTLVLAKARKFSPSWTTDEHIIQNTPVSLQYCHFLSFSNSFTLAACHCPDAAQRHERMVAV